MHATALLWHAPYEKQEAKYVGQSVYVADTHCSVKAME